ncbi:hypothetical protein ABH15_08420 [Methanoculleus taiwanensis]|uniref:Uncharacterized protein n=1 Tax=Methanoculleus taiwanensis TaxID=1550565 RepID=A0A498H0K8_9EURY|nr:hypothetical protein [Methanoculleus taiwanensis]RXE56173.1 hypothetical protein ABH15_08420 [Methanoculleus taiwanensis]
MKVVDFVAPVEFVANIDEEKDCIMSQDKISGDQKDLWFNIDVPKGHGVKAGDRVRIIIEKV